MAAAAEAANVALRHRQLGLQAARILAEDSSERPQSARNNSCARARNTPTWKRLTAPRCNRGAHGGTFSTPRYT